MTLIIFFMDLKEIKEISLHVYFLLEYVCLKGKCTDWIEFNSSIKFWRKFLRRFLDTVVL